jgi:hypothetical protein
LLGPGAAAAEAVDGLIVQTGPVSLSGTGPIPTGSIPAADPKATGLELPADTVFLRRSGDTLSGSVNIVNTTPSALIVTPSTVGADCSLAPAEPPGSGARIEPGGSAPVQITVPAGCDKLDTETLDISVLVSTVDGAKYEYATISVEGEVDWSSARAVLIGVLIASLTIAVVGGCFGIRAFNGAAPTPSRKVTWSDPLVADADTPKSWLTAIATVGPVATALFSTTNLLEGLTGHDPTAPKTLVLTGTAVALALVAIATMITNIPAVTVSVDKKNQDCPRVWHFVLAAGLTTSSAGIALASVWSASSTLDLPGGDAWVVVVGAGLALALAAYALWSVKRFIERFAQVWPAPQTPQPRSIPPELLAGALQSLAPKFIGIHRTTTINPGDQQRWLEASKHVASEMVEMLTRTDSSVATAAATTAASMAANVTKNLSEADNVPQEVKQGAIDAAAQAQDTAAQAQAASASGNPEQAFELAEQAANQAAAAINATGEATQDLGGPDVEFGVAEAEETIRKLQLLTTSPGDDQLADHTQPPERRPLTQFMI